jgi:hypothetical protein
MPSTKKNIFFKFSLLTAMSLVFLFLGNGLLAKSNASNFQHQSFKISSAQKSTLDFLDCSVFCDDNDDDEVSENAQENHLLSHFILANFISSKSPAINSALSNTFQCKVLPLLHSCSTLSTFLI